MNPSPPSGVFVYGYYGVGNFGDDLLARAVVVGLSKRGLGPPYYLRNYGPIESLADAPAVALTDLESKLLGRASLVSKFFGVIGYLAAHFAIFRRCRAFVLGGGTLVSGHSSRATLLLLHALVTLARIRRLRVYALGVGVTPLEGLPRLIAKHVLSQCNVVCVRDASSFSAVRAMAPSANVRLTSDLVFADQDPPLARSARGSPKGEAVTIGLTLAEPFLNDPVNTALKTRVVSAVAAALHVWTNQSVHVRFISFQEAELPDGTRLGDGLIWNELLKACSVHGGAQGSLSSVVITTSSLSEALSGLSIVVGMRFHGLVLAALNEVPFAGFSYDHKVSDICAAYGMPCSSLEGLSSDWLLEAGAAARRKAVDRAVTAKLARLSAMNFEAVSP